MTTERFLECSKCRVEAWDLACQYAQQDQEPSKPTHYWSKGNTVCTRHKIVCPNSVPFHLQWKPFPPITKAQQEQNQKYEDFVRQLETEGKNVFSSFEEMERVFSEAGFDVAY